MLSFDNFWVFLNYKKNELTFCQFIFAKINTDSSNYRAD